MPTDPGATPDADPGAEQATPDDAPQDKAQDTQRTQVDWERKSRELEKVLARQAQELGMLRKGTQPERDDDPEPEPEREPEPPKSKSRLERDSWTLAEQLYGEDAMAAYGRAAALLERAQTPADYVAAFEAYHQRRAGGDAPAAAAAQAPAPVREQPRIESNRPDVSPRSDLDQDAETALANRDSKGFFLAQLRKIRGE